MPSDDGKLDDAELKRTTDWVARHFDTKRCTVCNHDTWSIADRVVEVRPYAGGGITVGGSVYPQIMLICKTCGHTILINALLAGVVKSPEAKADG